MTSTVLVDDHLLLRILLDDEPPEFLPSGAVVATTGLWYHRLCRALAGDTVVGALSRQIGDVDAAVAAALVAVVIDLPETVQLLSLRTLGWTMGELVHTGARLNLLSLEAIAAARHLDAEICLPAADDNRPLRRAAESLGIDVRMVDDA